MFGVSRALANPVEQKRYIVRICRSYNISGDYVFYLAMVVIVITFGW